MSLKNYIKQIEEAVQPVQGQQPINGQQPAAPVQGQQPPQQGVATAPSAPTAPVSASTTPPAAPAMAGQQAQQSIAPTGAPGQQPTNGQQPEDILGQEQPLQEQGLEEGQLDEALLAIKETHPYEHKQFMEWGVMDESLFDRALEYFNKKGDVPRQKLINSPLEELKDLISKLYAKSHGLGVQSSGMVDEVEMDPAKGFQEEVIADSIEDRIGANPVPEKDPAKQNSFNTPAYQRKGNEQGMSSLEQRLKETDMFESKGKTEKTKTGLKHTGTYGKEYETDIEGNEKKIEKNEPKKGRGRPKKDGGETGKGFDSSALMGVMGGKKPKKEIGKVSAKHKLSDKEPVDESIAKWDAQLKTLLEGKQVHEGLTVSTSMGNEGGSDSVSVTASDDDAHELLKLITSAGLGIKKDAAADLMAAHGDSRPFSVNSDDEAAGDIEVVDFDDAQAGLEGEADDGMGALKQMLAAMGIGKDAAQEPKHPEGFEASDEEGEESDEEEISADEVGSDEFGADEEGEESSDEETSDDEEDSEEKEAVIDEEDVEEGNKFTGNLAKAREQGKEEADLDGDGDMEKVEEGKQECNECGAMYEGDSHECSHEKMEEDTQLNEWANKRGGSSEDEQYTADINFMMDVISGGLNGKKKDQSVMPSTKVYTVDVAEEMKKLAGIK